MRRLLGVGVAALVGLAPSLALAHMGIGSPEGFAHGLAHPVTGLDHILAMMMVGVLAFQLGARAVWLVPSTFVLVMAIGGLIGMSGAAMPFVETGIGLSVVVLGGVVALGIKAPTVAAMLLVGLFAVFHGYAHGAEIPEDAGGLGYGLGFLTGTALLHLAGIALGYGVGALGRAFGPAIVRLVGGLAAVAGVGILTGLI